MLVEFNTELQKSMHSDAEFYSYLDSGMPAYKFTAKPTKEGFFFTTSAPIQSEWAKTVVGIPGKKLADAIYSVRLNPIEKDLEKDIWNHFWRVQNVLGLFGSEAIYREDKELDESPTHTPETHSLEELLEAYDNEELNDMIRLLHENGIEISHEGMFTLEENGDIVADALLGSEKLKFAVAEDPTAIKALQSRGYAIIQADEIEKLKNIIGL